MTRGSEKFGPKGLYGLAKYIELLKNRNFVFYNIGQMVSQFASRLMHIALIGIVYKIAPGSTIQLAKIFFFTAIPTFLISPVAGVCVDRFNKKHVLITADIVRSLTVLIIPLFFLRDTSLVPIYCVVFIVFTSACFFLPAKLSIIPELVRKETLLIANSFAMASWTVAGIIGFTVGAFLIEFSGLKFGLYLNSLIYFTSAIILSFLFVHKKPSAHKLSLKEMEKDLENAIKKSFLYDLKEGIVYLISHKDASFVVGIFFAFMSVAGALYVVMIVFIQELTRSVTRSIGVFGVFLFLGFLIGSYLYGRAGHIFSRVKAIFLSFILSGFFIVLFAFALRTTGLFWLGSVFIFLLGISISPVATSGNTIIHETIDEGMRGRVFSLMGIIMNGGFILFMFLSSILAEHVDRMWIILACGFILSFVGVIGYVFSKRGRVTSFGS